MDEVIQYRKVTNFSLMSDEYFQHIMNIHLIVGSEGWRWATDLQGNQVEQPHHAQLQTHNRWVTKYSQRKIYLAIFRD